VPNILTYLASSYVTKKMKYCEYAPRPLNIRLGPMYVGDEGTSFYEIETRNGRLQLEGHLSSQNPSHTEKPEKKVLVSNVQWPEL
jgi:hypothetical protein